MSDGSQLPDPVASNNGASLHHIQLQLGVCYNSDIVLELQRLFAQEWYSSFTAEIRKGCR